MHAFARRVGDDKVGNAVFLHKLAGKDLGHVAGKKLRVGDTVQLRIDAGVLYGIFHIFDADYLGCQACHVIGDGSRAGIEVIHGLMRLDVGKIGGQAIQTRRLPGVGLIKGLGSHAKFQVGNTLPVGGHLHDKERFAGKKPYIQIGHAVVYLGVDRIHKALDAGKARRKAFHQRMESRVGFLADDEHHHEISVQGITEHDVAHIAALVADVVEVQTEFLCGLLYEKAYLVARFGLEETALEVQHFVELARQMETQALAPVLVERLALRNLAIGEPAFGGKGEFEFVAVSGIFFHVLHADYRHSLRQGYLADAFQMVAHLRLFLAKLFCVLQMLPLAASAKPEMAAKRLATQGTGFLQGQHAPLHIARFGTYHLNIRQVARSGVVYKQHLAVYMRQRIALGGGFLNADILYNPVGSVLVSACHITPRKKSLSVG